MSAKNPSPDGTGLARVRLGGDVGELARREGHTGRDFTRALSCLNSGQSADSHHSNSTLSAVVMMAPEFAIRSSAIR